MSKILSVGEQHFLLIFKTASLWSAVTNDDATVKLGYAVMMHLQRLVSALYSRSGDKQLAAWFSSQPSIYSIFRR